MTMFQKGSAPADAIFPIHSPFQGVIDTRQVTPGNRLNYWNERVNRSNGLDIHCGTENFLARMQTRCLGLCTLHAVKIETPHRAVRARSDDNLVFVNVQVANDGAWYNGRREYAMIQGSMVLYEACEPYELDFDGRSESYVLAVPRSEMNKRITNLQSHLDDAVEYDKAKTHLLGELMRGILQSPSGTTTAVNDGLSESLLNLLVATLYDVTDDNARAPTHGVAATLQRIKCYINQNISDPNLNPVSTADAMGITVSYLHKIFMQNNTTLMQYVLGERLERCRRDIAKSDRSGGISQIAYSWGFNDASHFSRSFRKRFNISPREYRAQVIQRKVRMQL